MVVQVRFLDLFSLEYHDRAGYKEWVMPAEPSTALCNGVVMPVRSFLVALTALTLTAATQAEGVDSDTVLRAIQEKVTQAARGAGPSIVRVHISRSTAYAKDPIWGEPGGNPAAGELGRFDADQARKRVPEDARNRTRILRSISDHDLSNPRGIPESYGGGVVVGKGLVLTSAHVVRNATRIYVRFPGKKGSWADIHASDPRSDLAVLRLLDPPDNVPILPLGKGESVRKGQYIIGMANPLVPGFRGQDEPVVNQGIVTALRRRPEDRDPQMEHSRKKLYQYGTLLQVDARTSAGCSGGVLLDLEGKAIGLTTSLAAITGGELPGVTGRNLLNLTREQRREIALDPTATYALPFDANTRRIIEVLKRGEEVEYGFLGVVLSGGNAEFQQQGVYIHQISPGSPAFKAGLRGGEILHSVNGTPINNQDDIFLHIGMSLAGTEVRIRALRGSQLQTYTATLAKYYVEGPVIASKRPPARFGLRVDHNSILAQRNPFGRARWPADGVIIREVVPGSPADKALLQPDKIITHVNDEAVTTPTQYYEQIRRAGKKVTLTYLSSENRVQELTLEEK